MDDKSQGTYVLYRFNDGTSYKAEIGKDGVTKESMRHLRRVIKSQAKAKTKADKLDTVSIEVNDNCFLVDGDENIELIIEIAEEYDALHRAIEELTPQQQDMLQKIYFQRVSARKYAKEIGVSHTTINKQLKETYQEIKKNLKKI